MKSFRVATFVNERPSGTRYWNAYTRDYNESWSGCRMYTVLAKNGTEAKRIAISLRKADDENGNVIPVEAEK